MATESSSIPKNEIDVCGPSSLSGSAGRPSSLNKPAALGALRVMKSSM